jgi:TRAP-type C4-dicarboxylate transport system permease small subunit
MAVEARIGWAGLVGFARRFVEWWALAGGIVLLGVALMTAWSAASSWVFGRPLPGDFELTEIFVAVAIFAFLPYCQITNANVTADLFTSGAGPRAIAGFTLFASLLALAIAALLTWRTWAGLLDYRRYVETTAILKIPIWTAYVPALTSLGLLVLACVISLLASWRALLRG